MSARSAERIVRTPPRARQALHRHHEARLILFFDGMLTERAFEGRQHFQRGDVLFRPAYFAHADDVSAAGSTYTHLNASPAAVGKWLSMHGWRPARMRLSDWHDATADEILVACRPVTLSPAPLSGILEQAASQLAAPDPPKVADVADACGLSPSCFARKFLSEFGVRAVTYRRQACIQRAIFLLSMSRGSFADIAVAAGFHDQSHMTHSIRAETGLTPSALAAVFGR